jgi:plastocyanin
MKANHVCIAVALISASACGGGGGGGGTTGPPAGNTPPPAGGISVTNNAFSPSSKTVAPGTTVEWAWNTCSGGDGYGSGETCVAHGVNFDDGISSPTQSQGRFSRNFGTAGSYPYRCAVHGSAMSGTVTVQ